MTRKNVLILFGGQSAEHDVSLESAKNIATAIDANRYNAHLVGIDRQGKWHRLPKLSDLQATDVTKPIDVTKFSELVFTVPRGGQVHLVNVETGASYGTVDLAFPALHGPFGEDGTIQGMFKMLGIPFVGPSVLGSSVGMDKEVAKRLWQAAGIPVAKFATLYRHEFDAQIVDSLIKQLGLPFFIKPSNMGSSVGVYKIKRAEDFRVAAMDAFNYDYKLLAEEFVEGREVECSVLGNEVVQASIAGELFPTHEFYSYDAKYLDPNGARVQIPADLDSQLMSRIRETAIRAFRCIECEGMARVDFFVRKNGEIMVNEINTIPGFTKISMYPKMWGATGLEYKELIQRLLDLAEARFEREKKIHFTRA